jgi:hypothetical protein
LNGQALESGREQKMEGLMALTQTRQAAANMAADGVIQPMVFHVAGDHG